jgi:hypothetical protein
MAKRTFDSSFVGSVVDWFTLTPSWILTVQTHIWETLETNERYTVQGQAKYSVLRVPTTSESNLFHRKVKTMVAALTTNKIPCTFLHYRLKRRHQFVFVTGRFLYFYDNTCPPSRRNEILRRRVKNYPHYKYMFCSWLYCWLVMPK